MTIELCEGAMVRLPRKYAPFAYGIIQAAITTAVATAVTTHQPTGFGSQFLARWGVAWLTAWIIMLPLVVLIAPLVQRAVLAMTGQDGS